MTLAPQRFAVGAAAAAENDLVAIAAGYAERHPVGTDRFFRDFQKARDMLAQQPKAGRERNELRKGLRSWPVHPYLLSYTVDARKRTIVIERVIHGHMDIDDEDF